MNLGANLLDSLSNPVSCGVVVSRSFEGIEGSCPGTLAALNESLHRRVRSLLYKGRVRRPLIPKCRLERGEACGTANKGVEGVFYPHQLLGSR